MDKTWLKEAIFAGNSANGFKLGTVLTLGWFWPRVSGCSILYRGRSLEQIDFANVLAVANIDAGQISPSMLVSNTAESAYYYVVRRIDNLGRQEQTFSATIKVSIDSDGKLAAEKCNNVFVVAGRQISGVKAQLIWYYCPIGQQAEPCCFNVYSDEGTGQVDYENPAASILYTGPGFYSYQSQMFPAGEYLFAIRAKDEGEVENLCWAQLQVQLTDSEPEVVDILSVEVL